MYEYRLKVLQEKYDQEVSSKDAEIAYLKAELSKRMDDITDKSILQFVNLSKKIRKKTDNCINDTCRTCRRRWRWSVLTCSFRYAYET